MRKTARVLGGAMLAAGLLLSVASPASAAVSTTRESETIVGVGSDNTYEVMNDLDQLYNESPGCATIPSTGSFTNFKQLCIDGGQLTYAPNYAQLIETENLYHDRVVESHPVGSSNGRLVLQAKISNPSSATDADFSRASSKQTFSLPSGFAAYGVAYGRDAMAPWVGKNNTLVNANSSGVPLPAFTIADLKNAFVGNASGDCAINWSSAVGDSIGNALGAPASGTIDIFGTQPGSGSGLDFLRKIDPSTTYSNAAALANCIPAALKDGGSDDRVIFENNANPICTYPGGSKRSTALYSYGFGRFVQNKGGTGACAGVLGAINTGSATIKPTVVTIGRVTGGYPLSGYRYNYVVVPTTGGFDVNDRTTWTGTTRAVLDYLHPTLGWLCKPTHATDPISGVNYRTRIEKTMKADGFAPLALGPVGGTTFTGQSYCRDAATT
jgi:hypothetical protein